MAYICQNCGKEVTDITYFITCVNCGGRILVKKRPSLAKEISTD
ncbi:MAG: DNA-directed RNA polymerase subunit P [Candidatus Marsarchaeota archaeon]|nr:DNA-directed RNA polymerase subunit P [Candidatus Marsarchaeota archaeon]MCL5094491.1 DNA-directed RNA polymerase subunit P [Candidatus Marsarchaeota archaeon]